MAACFDTVLSATILLEWIARRTMGHSQRYWEWTWNIWWRLESRDPTPHIPIETFSYILRKAEDTEAKWSKFKASVVGAAIWSLPVLDLATVLRNCLLKRPFLRLGPDSGEKKAAVSLRPWRRILVCLKFWKAVSSQNREVEFCWPQQPTSKFTKGHFYLCCFPNLTALLFSSISYINYM